MNSLTGYLEPTYRKTRWARRIIHGVCGLITVATLLLGGAHLVASSIPEWTMYVRPDGSCAILVKVTDRGRVGRDCGGQVGASYDVVTISHRADIRKLHDGIAMP